MPTACSCTMQLHPLRRRWPQHAPPACRLHAPPARRLHAAAPPPHAACVPCLHAAPRLHAACMPTARRLHGICRAPCAGVATARPTCMPPTARRPQAAAPLRRRWPQRAPPACCLHAPPACRLRADRTQLRMPTACRPARSCTPRRRGHSLRADCTQLRPLRRRWPQHVPLFS